MLLLKYLIVVYEGECMSTTFEFGKNWKTFIEKHFSEERAYVAYTSLLNSLAKENLNGLDFLDIGSGSGLHSLAAFRAGAKRVVSFDYDENSVATTKALWHMEGEPQNWIIMQGSVLDRNFMAGLGKFDLVYSWGVLHHTGNMWQGIENSLLPMHENSILFIALYSDTIYRDSSYVGWPTPEKWLEIKQKYNSGNKFTKKRLEYSYIYYNYFKSAGFKPGALIRAYQNFARDVKKYSKDRGMEYWVNLRDWLGGWPMEFVVEQDFIDFMKKNSVFPLRINSGAGNTEFLCRPKNASNYWDEILSKRVIREISTEIQHERGAMYSFYMPELKNSDTDKIEFTIFEDDIPLGFRHANLIGVIEGKSRYAHRKDKILFSTSDMSDPRTNNRRYTYCLEM